MMKSLHHYINIVVFFAGFLSACKVKHAEQSNNFVIQHQLSLEIESTKAIHPSGFFQITGKDFSSHRKMVVKASSYEIGNIVSEKTQSSKIKNNKIEGRSFLPAQGLFISSKKVDKNNTFWKIGQALLKVGVAILGVSGGVVISSNGSGILLFGLLIGLAVIVMSIPFFLLALISDHMKKRSSPGKGNGYDEEI